MARLLSGRSVWTALPAIIGCMALLGFHAGPARADAFNVSFEAAGIQSANQAGLCANLGAGPCTIGVENFDTRTTNTAFTTNFGTSGTITGTYSAMSVSAADQYGGAGGTGKYPSATGTAPYSLTLSTTLTTGINYFGYWLSALDAGNQVAFYKGSVLVYSFAPSTLIAALGACSTSNAYCGNPNSQFPNANNAQQYAFVNFLDTNGTFDTVKFTENPANGGYESDNHTVGYATAATGSAVNIPEPASLAMLAVSLGSLCVGLVGIGFARQRWFVRRRKRRSRRLAPVQRKSFA